MVEMISLNDAICAAYYERRFWHGRPVSLLDLRRTLRRLPDYLVGDYRWLTPAQIATAIWCGEVELMFEDGYIVERPLLCGHPGLF